MTRDQQTATLLHEWMACSPGVFANDEVVMFAQWLIETNRVTVPDVSDAGDWIIWHGGKRPVPRGTRHQIKTADGWVSEPPSLETVWCDEWWLHLATSKNDNIVAYRTVPQS